MKYVPKDGEMGLQKDWSQGDYIHHAMPFYEALKVTGKFEIKYKPVEGKNVQVGTRFGQTHAVN